MLSRFFFKISAFTIALSACAQPVPHDLQSSGMAAFDESNYRASQLMFSEQRVVRSSFSVKEGVVIAASVSWRDAAAKGGEHDVDWRIMQGDKVLREKHDVETLGAEPAVLLSHISADSFPAGEYQVVLAIDHAPFSETSIRVAAVPPKRTATDFSIGSDCSGGPEDSIKPLQRLKPNFPVTAMEHNLGGCALVAVVLDDDGHPADVKILAEHPDKAGFGQALAEASWNARFPSGHSGEVSFLHRNYRVSK